MDHSTEPYPPVNMHLRDIRILVCDVSSSWFSTGHEQSPVASFAVWDDVRYPSFLSLCSLCAVFTWSVASHQSARLHLAHFGAPAFCSCLPHPSQPPLPCVNLPRCCHRCDSAAVGALQLLFPSGSTFTQDPHSQENGTRYDMSLEGCHAKHQQEDGAWVGLEYSLMRGQGVHSHGPSLAPLNWI